MSRYGCYAAALCEKVRRFIDGRDSTSLSVAFELLEEVEGLQTESYEQKIPRCSEMCAPSSTNRRAGIPLGPRTTFARTLFCSYRLKFLLCGWELFKKIETLSSGRQVETLHLQYQHNVSQIQAVADEILATVPNALDKSGYKGQTRTTIASFWADGIRLLWPLRLLAFWPVPRADQRKSAALMLRSLRDAMGLQQAAQDLVVTSESHHPAATTLSAVVST